MKIDRTNKKSHRGFTLVELIVVMAIMALLAVLVGAGIISYTRVARFNKNEANARTIYQAAQTSLTRMEASGGLDDFVAKIVGGDGVAPLGLPDTFFPGDSTLNDEQRAKMASIAEKVKNRVYYIFYDKDTPESDSSKLVEELLGDYIYDKSLMNASMCIEIDTVGGNIFAVFYDSNSGAFTFANPPETGKTSIADRSYQHRYSETQVGYYSVDDLINSVHLEEKIKLEIRKLALVNGEQLTLEWSTNASGAVNPGIEYKAYIFDGTEPVDPAAKPILTITIQPGNTYNAGSKYIQCSVTDKDDKQLGDFWFPMVNDGGTFKLTLDAMVSAEILQKSEADATGAGAYAKQYEFSMARFLGTDSESKIFAKMSANPVEDNETAKEMYTESNTSKETETRSPFFDDDTELDTLHGTGYTGVISNFRHLYNLRWLKENHNGTFTIAPDVNDTMDWTPEPPAVPNPGDDPVEDTIVVYQTPTDPTNPASMPEAATPTKDAAVAFPTIDELPAGITLEGGGNAIIKNLQLRTDSVAPDVTLPDSEYYAKYVGLIGHNYGTVQNLTLQDVDAVINVPGFDAATSDDVRDKAIKPVEEATLTKATPLPLSSLRGVGALCGINTGVTKNIKLTEDTEKGGTSRVVAVVPFGNSYVGEMGEGTVDLENISTNPALASIYVHNVRGIGGLVGISRPALTPEASAKVDAGKPEYQLNNLTTNGTVTGMLLDMTAPIEAPADDEAYYKTALANNSNYMPIGIGGTVGMAVVTDGIGSDETAPAERMVLTNSALVLGNGYTGGVAGNLLAQETPSGAAPALVPGVTLSDLTNNGRVQATAAFVPDTSKSLGRFFGGVAGYTAFTGLEGAKNTFTVQTGKEDEALTLGGVQADLASTAPQYFKGDFVGGITGFVDTGVLKDCVSGATISADLTADTNTYVLGDKFVGGYVGGSNASQLSGNTNNAVVIGREYVGGIVGAAGNGTTLDTCKNLGLVAAVGSADGTQPAHYVGGIVGVVGFADDAGAPPTTLTACSNTSGDGFADYLENIGALETKYTGGVVGYNAEGSTLVVDGPVLTTLTGENYVGGVVGYNAGSIKINDGDITAKLTGKDFVGGVVGYNTGSIELGVGTVTATLTAKDFVGGLVGANATTGTITGTGLVTVEGTIEGVNAVGGAIGLNRAPALPAEVTVNAEVTGYRYVGGILGANMPAGAFTIGTAKTDTACTVSADGVAGGFIGYNRPTDATTVTDVEAAETADIELSTYYNESLLPTIDPDTSIITGNAAVTDATTALGFENLENKASVTANAYAAGLIGYSDEHVTLTLKNCGNAAGISRRDDAQTWEDVDGNPLPTMENGVSLLNYFATSRGYDALYTTAPNAIFTDTDPDVKTAMIGGIISVSDEKNTLEKCANTGEITGKGNGFGGLTALNLGTVKEGSNTTSIGNTNQNFVGGLVGINAKTTNGTGTITDGTVKGSGTTVAVTGGRCVGGLAGANLWGATVTTVENFETTVTGTSQTGGVSGLNCGTVSGSMANSEVNGVTDTGAAVGRNVGTVTAMVVADTVKVYGSTNAGGVAGLNNGTIGVDADSIRTAASVSASNDCAGGVAGYNADKAKILNATVTAGTIKSANGVASGIAACNAGEITDCTIGNDTAATITIQSKSIHKPDPDGTDSFTGAGAAVAINLQTGKLVNIVLDADNDVSTVTLDSDKAENIGGLVGYNMGTVQDSKVRAMPTLTNLTVESAAVGGAVGYNHNPYDKDNPADDKHPATVSGTEVRTVILADNDKILQLGGVAGNNDGTLFECTYTGTLGDGTDSDIAPANFKLGGVAGNNTARIENCKAIGVNLQIAGRIDSASNLGGIVGYNDTDAVITGSTVAVGDSNTTSFIIARYGNVGGVAGSNAGLITRSGSEAAMEMVDAVNGWLYAPTDPSKTVAEQTEAQNGLRAAMDRVLSGDAVNSNPDEKALTVRYNALKGIDPVSTPGKGYGAVYNGTTNGNDVLVAMSAPENGTSQGYLGGLVGYNLAGGSVTESATGKWFVYGDNLDQNSTGTLPVAVGGAIGRNESDAETRNIINNAAVRRFTRFGTTNDGDISTALSSASITHVGGVVGVQNNTTSATWTLNGAINCGTVFNSNGSNVGGVVARWTGNGGTVHNSYNYGSLTTNWDSATIGVVGGIVGTADVTGSDLRILSCRNFGNINRMADTAAIPVIRGATEAAGILGHITAAAAAESRTVNIIDCLNGNDSLDAGRQTAGICGRLTGDNALNTFINIDRCRNYSTALTVEQQSGTYTAAAGISAPRSAGRDTADETTGFTSITNCFALYTNGVPGVDAAPFIGPDDGEPAAHFAGKNNYYMDDASFDAANNAGLVSMTRTDPAATDIVIGSAPAETAATGQVVGHRLFAGADTEAAPTDDPNNYKYFAALLTLDNSNDTPIYNPASILPTNSYITAYDATNMPAFADRTVLRRLTEGTPGTNTLATLPLLYNEGDENPALSIHDVRDNAITSYYNYLLETEPLTPPGKPVITKNENATGADYKSYTVSWTAPTQGTVDYYRVVLYRETVDPLNPEVVSDVTVYGTRFVQAMAKADDGKNIFAIVTARNSRSEAQSERSDNITVVEPLALMQLSLEMLGDGKTAAVTLLNADTYNNTAGAGCWTATASLTAADGNSATVQLDANTTTATVETEALATDADGLLTLTGYAEVVPGTPAAERYYRSNEMSKEVYLPTQLPAGQLMMEMPIIRGATMDEVAISATLGFTSSTGVQPVYHVALLGRRTAPLADEATGIELQGQYITLGAQDVRLPQDAMTITFTRNELPADILDNYDDFTMIAIPYESGRGDCRTYHAMSAEELASTGLGTAAAEAVLNSGVEILRNPDGNGWIYRAVTPLAMAQQDTTDTCRRDALNITVLPAPTLMEGFATDQPQVTDSTMTYTFTWTAPETAMTFRPLLTGLTYNENGEVDTETSIDVTDAYPDDTATTLTVDAAGWAFDAVHIAVTPKGEATVDGYTLGRTATAEYAVQQRLARLGGVSVENADVTGRSLRYTVRWDAPDADAAANMASVTVFATDAAGKVLQTANASASDDGTLPTSLVMDLEPVQGQTVQLYVAANPTGAEYLRSAYSDAVTLEVPPRSAAPQIATATVTVPTVEADITVQNTPENAVARTQFEEGLTVSARLTEEVQDGNYLGSVYLYEDADAAAAAVERINAGEAPAKQQTAGDGGWLYAIGTDENAPMAGGFVMERATDPKTLTLAMPLSAEYAGRYVVLRICAAPFGEIASTWVAAATAAPLPQIMQDTPQAAEAMVEQTVQAALYADAELQTPLENTPITELSFARKTVQWAPSAEATGYTVELTPANDENHVNTRLTVTVQPRDALDEAGNVTVPAGAIIKVEKTQTLENGEEQTFEIPDTAGYDLSVVAVPQTEGEGISLVAVPVTLRGTQPYGDGEAVWAFDATPVLYFDTEASLYTIALPDAAAPIEGSFSADVYTGTVTVTAIGGEGVLPSATCVVELPPESPADEAQTEATAENAAPAPIAPPVPTPMPEDGNSIAALVARLTQSARNATTAPPTSPEPQAPPEAAEQAAQETTQDTQDTKEQTATDSVQQAAKDTAAVAADAAQPEAAAEAQSEQALPETAEQPAE